MLETIVQDYVEAALKLPLATFGQQVDVPVLITALPDAGPSFQDAATRMLAEGKRFNVPAQAKKLDHRASVHDLRPRKTNRIGQVTIGRSEDNDLVLTDETISSRHAIYAPDPKTGRPTLQDQESTNGTWLNDQRLLPYRNAFLPEGALISFGDMMFLFFTPEGFYNALRSLSSASE
jgi:hypothetical protein